MKRQCCGVSRWPALPGALLAESLQWLANDVPSVLAALATCRGWSLGSGRLGAAAENALFGALYRAKLQVTGDPVVASVRGWRERFRRAVRVAAAWTGKRPSVLAGAIPLDSAVVTQTVDDCNGVHRLTLGLANGDVALFSLATGTQLARWRAHRRRVVDVALPGRAVYGDAELGPTVTQCAAQCAAQCAESSTLGDVSLASADARQVHCWGPLPLRAPEMAGGDDEPTRPAIVLTVEVEAGDAWDFCFVAPLARRLYALSGRQASVLDLRTGALLTRVALPAGAVRSAWLSSPHELIYITRLPTGISESWSVALPDASASLPAASQLLALSDKRVNLTAVADGDGGAMQCQLEGIIHQYAADDQNSLRPLWCDFGLLYVSRPTGVFCVDPGAAAPAEHALFRVATPNARVVDVDYDWRFLAVVVRSATGDTIHVLDFADVGYAPLPLAGHRWTPTSLVPTALGFVSLDPTPPSRQPSALSSGKPPS